MFFVQVCPIWRGLICRGPICHSTKKCGAQFAAKSAQGPICLEPTVSESKSHKIFFYG